MTVLFSFLFLLTTYFLTALALLQVYVPGGIKAIKETEWKMQQFMAYKKIMLISLFLASFASWLMFYFFIFPYT